MSGMSYTIGMLTRALAGPVVIIALSAAVVGCARGSDSSVAEWRALLNETGFTVVDAGKLPAGTRNNYFPYWVLAGDTSWHEFKFAAVNVLAREGWDVRDPGEAIRRLHAVRDDRCHGYSDLRDDTPEHEFTRFMLERQSDVLERHSVAGMLVLVVEGCG